MKEDSFVYVGVDVAKEKHAVTVAEGGRSGEVRYLGEVETTPVAVERLVRKLEKTYGRLHLCYEAGPTAYGLHRQIIAMGQSKNRSTCEGTRKPPRRSELPYATFEQSC